MEESDAGEGVEVNHPEYGRGVVTEYLPNFGAEPDDVAVRFYEREEPRTLPVYAVELAHEVTIASVEPGSSGFTAVVDDGFGTIVVQPNGTGDGYSVEVLVDGERMDRTEVSHRRG